MASGEVRTIKGSNITVVALEGPYGAGTPLALLHGQQPDDEVEVAWLQSQRPLPNMVHPAVAFQQGIKTLRPAIIFNTYTPAAARARRAERQALQAKRTAAHRAARIAPTAAMKVLNNDKRHFQYTEGPGSRRDAEFSRHPVLRRLQGPPKARARTSTAAGLEKARTKAKKSSGKKTGTPTNGDGGDHDAARPAKKKKAATTNDV